MEKPEGLVRNVLLRTHDGTRGDMTGYVTSPGEPDVGGGPGREKRRR